MKHIIIGTAGHVDHGKTTLIQALTGTNPDRLKEEQERGMTIDIGFAALKLPDGTIAGIVDVPGHERFLKNMLAGISGVDVVLLVIAADEGIMPQTSEHLDILRILDVKNGVIALTKIDLVEKEWTDVIEEDVREQIKDTFLAKSPIIRVSATTGKGVEALKKTLMSSVSRAEARNSSLPFRLPIDRVFTRPGFGTVVTGTLVAGALRIGDTVEITPQKIISRVRGLQVHGQKVTVAEAGSRVAVNLAGVELDSVERGAQLAAPESILPTTTFDAALRLLPTIESPLKDRQRVRIHIGTAEIIGRVRLLEDNSEMKSGGEAYIQFRGESEFCCQRGDRFVLRTYSPMNTIGGGTILDSSPEKHRKGSEEALETLKAKERGTPEDLILTTLLRYPVGISRKELLPQLGTEVGIAQQAIQTLFENKKITGLTTDRLIHHRMLKTLQDRAVSLITEYHEQFPLRPGVPKEELRTSLNREMEPRAFGPLLHFWERENVLLSEGASVRLAVFKLTLNERQQNLLDRIGDAYRRNGIAPPSIAEVSKEVAAPQDAVTALIRVGVDQGVFHRVSDGIFYHTSTVDELKKMATDYLSKNPSLTVGAFRDLTESNRNQSLQLLEYFDQIKFTRRIGNDRTLY